MEIYQPFQFPVVVLVLLFVVHFQSCHLIGKTNCLFELWLSIPVNSYGHVGTLPQVSLITPGRPKTLEDTWGTTKIDSNNVSQIKLVQFYKLCTCNRFH